MKQPLVAIGLSIRAHRLRRGLSQEQLAEAAGLHRTYIGGVERGERNLGIENFLAIATALNVHPAVLFEYLSPDAGEDG